MKKLYGITVALLTPISRDTQEVDYQALVQHVERMVSKGVHCIYCCGTDAEMYHLTTEERKKIAETVVKAAEGKAVVYVHCGAMRQEDTLELVQHAQRIGADGVGMVTPSYYPMTDRELVEFYQTVAQSVKPDFPVYVYNIPQLAVNDIKPSVVQEIAEKCPNVVGIKYNYPNINQTLDYLRINDGTFSVLQGDDRTLTAWLAMGCSGTVAGSANVFPEPLVAGYKAFMEGDLKSALKYANIAAEFIDAMKNDDIAYFKAALAIRGIDVGTMKKPLLELDEASVKELRSKLEAVCKKHGIELKLSA